jgi:hypothetical protein
MTPIRKCYVFRPPLVARGVTPAAEIEPDVLAIVAAWNCAIPKNRCRILDQARFEQIRYCLELLPLADILSAVQCYGSQAWNIRTQAWQKFDHWMDRPNVLTWYEKSADDAERRQASEDRKRQAAQPAVSTADYNAVQRRLSAMPAEDRRLLWASAKNDTARLIEILKQRDAAGGEGYG